MVKRAVLSAMGAPREGHGGTDDPGADRGRRARGPSAGTGGVVRIRVHACGVCYSDHVVTHGLWPGLELPRIPGHEVASVADGIAEGVLTLRVGDRVGVGWFRVVLGVTPN